MKMLVSAIALFPLIATPTLVTGRNFDRIGAGQPNKRDLAVAKTVGFSLSKPYQATRKDLIRLGWMPDQNWGRSGVHEKPPFPKYPEILCGEGYDAICTSRLSKGKNSLLLTVNQDFRDLPVIHAEFD